MLRIDCENCGGFGLVPKNLEKMVDCPECKGTGRIEQDENKKVYVNAYVVTRHYGGAEEGGWYYNHFECIETVPTKNKYSTLIAKDMELEWGYLRTGNIYSVKGGTQLIVKIEEQRCQSETKQRPVYE